MVQQFLENSKQYSLSGRTVFWCKKAKKVLKYIEKCCNYFLKMVTLDCRQDKLTYIEGGKHDKNRFSKLYG
jgi:deoxyadenosine/deoxycytidine kinase